MILRGDHNQCPQCSEFFNSSAAFDKHRTGDYSKSRECLKPTEMIAKGMSKNSEGWWITSASTQFNSKD